MTGAEAVALLAGRLGQRTGLTAMIVSELNAAQETRLEKAGFLPWFLEKDKQDLATVPVQEYVDLPSDFLGFDEELSALYYNDASGSVDPWVPIARDMYVNFKERNRNPGLMVSSAVVVPENFDILGTRLYLRPIPMTVLTLRMIYMQKQAAVANDTTTNLWLTHAHDWLLGEAGVMLAGFQTQNPDLGGLFATMAAAGKTRVQNETTARREAARMAAMGED